MKPRRSREVAAGALALLLAGLAGPIACAPAPAASTAVAAPLAIGAAAVPAPAPTLRAEPAPRAPAELTLLVRVNDPELLARELVSVLPPGAASALGQLDAPQLASMLLGTKLAGVVDLTQPVDLATLGTGDTSFVVSLAVKPEAESRLGERFTLQEEGGLQRVAPAEERDGSRLAACAFAAAAGRAPMRLVCASDDPTLEAAARYLVRGVAGEAFDADARLTVPGRVLRDKSDPTAKALGEAASAQLGRGLVEKLVGEIERFDGELRFTGKGVEVGLDLRLSARASLLGRALVPASKAAAPPRAFYRLPADALLALHTTGTLPEDVAPLRRALAENLEASLVVDGYQAAKTRALREQIEALVLTGGPLVVAAGVVAGREGAEKALAAIDGSARPAELARVEAQARRALAPWTILEVEEPGERWTRGLRDIIKGADDADRTRAPGSRSSTPPGPDSDHVDVRVGVVDAALRLPKETLHLEVSLTPVTKGKHPARKAHLLVVPKGSATWLGYSEELGALAARLRLVTDDTLEEGTLARSADAASLRARPALAAGLTSMAGLTLLAGKTVTHDDLRALARTTSELSALGSRGAEALTWTVHGDTTPGSVHIGARLPLTRQALSEVIQRIGM
jgi:hypothetical protein